MPGDDPKNLPPQTGIIDFLRRMSDPGDPTLLRQFTDKPDEVMTIAGLTPDQKTAILSGDNDRITRAIGAEYYGVLNLDYIRFAHAVSPSRNLDYTFPEEPPPKPPAIAMISDLRQTLNQLIEQLDHFSATLE